MILEVPNIKLGSVNVFKIIKEDMSYIKEPIYYPITDFLISVFEKKDIDKKEEIALNELKIAKFIRNRIEEKNYIIIYKENENLVILIKENNEYKFLQKYKLEIQSLITIYENYNNFNFYFLDSESLKELILKMKDYYSKEEIESKFFKIETVFEEKDFKELKYNDNLFLILKTRYLENKKKYNYMLFLFFLMIIILIGYKYYSYIEEKKEQERVLLLSDKPVINLENMNLNYNKYLILKDLLELNFENLNIEKRIITGIVYSKIEKDILYLIEFGKGFYFESFIKSISSRSEKDIKKNNIENFIKNNFFNVLKERNKYYISETINKNLLLDFILFMSYNNEYIYDIFIKKNNDVYDITLYVEKKGQEIK